MDLNAFYEAEFDQHKDALEATREALWEPFSQLIGVSAKAIRAGNKLVLFGNGGSAADCQHIATELIVRYITDRDPIRAMAETHPNPRLRESAEEWLEKLEKAQEETNDE